MKLEKLINKEWRDFFRDELKKDYMSEILSILEVEYQHKIIFPKQSNIFNAFNSVKLENLKVVIIGQDPYHGDNQAHGLAFSVLPGVKVPPSLLNIFKELNREYGIPISKNGCLESWANEGVLLLNTILTVEKGKPLSHKDLGWEKFTSSVIEKINNNFDHIVFIAWGAPAIKKLSSVNTSRHMILTSVHPSPLSAYRGFIGCDHFKKCNEYLKSKNREEINWSIE